MATRELFPAFRRFEFGEGVCAPDNKDIDHLLQQVQKIAQKVIKFKPNLRDHAAFKYYRIAWREVKSGIIFRKKVTYYALYVDVSDLAGTQQSADTLRHLDAKLIGEYRSAESLIYALHTHYESMEEYLVGEMRKSLRLATNLSDDEIDTRINQLICSVDELPDMLETPVPVTHLELGPHHRYYPRDGSSAVRISHDRNPQEGQYLILLNGLFDKFRIRGSHANRTAVKTVKFIGYTMRFDLSGGKVPVLTTKKIYLRAVIGELVKWFLRGDTNNQTLNDLNISIWDEWALTEDYIELKPLSRNERIALLAERWNLSPEETSNRLFETARKSKKANTTRKLHDAVDALLTQEGIARNAEHVVYPKGYVGPLYGFQWRHFPAGNYFHNLSEREVVEYIEAMLPDQRAIFEEQCRRNQDGSFSITSARSVLSSIGIDQIAQAIDLLRRRPTSRRIIVTAWNPQVVPSDAISPQDNIILGRAGLASCHHMFQFLTEELTFEERREQILAEWARVATAQGRPFDPSTMLVKPDNVDGWLKEDGSAFPKYRLSIKADQRSCDTFLGVPFNIASYGILVHLVAAQVNMVPGELVWNGGDVHLYDNHLNEAAIQLQREPYPFPTIKLNPNVPSIVDYEIDDIQIENYQSHPAIRARVAV